MGKERGRLKTLSSDRDLNRVRCEAIVRRTEELFPAAGDAEQAQFWTGLRPATPSNLPIIGRSAGGKLYLGTRAATVEAVLAAPGPKRMHVTLLRDINANELGRLFTRGMEDNAPKGVWSKSIPGTIRMSDIFSARKKLAAGDAFSVDYVPGQGTTVLVNGKPQNEPIKEPEFFNALLRIWLGSKPTDPQLKEALLGRALGAPAGSQQ